MTRRRSVSRLICAVGLCALAASVLAADRVRESALAGGWYPAAPAQLQAQVDGFLAKPQGLELGDPVRALIVPHAGYAYSGPTAGQAFTLVKDRTYKRVMVLAPSHYGNFRGLSIADADAYRTPLGDIPLDQEATETLRASPLAGADAGADAHEHSIEIELPLLQRALTPGWRLVPVLVGRLDGGDYQAAADLLRPLADAATLVVVSSDFTHYGPRFAYLPFPSDQETPGRLRELDDGAIDRILAKDADGFLGYRKETGITMCGFRPIEILLRMLGPSARLQRVAYATSGALTGDWTNSVSYAALVVTNPEALSAGGPGLASPTPKESQGGGAAGDEAVGEADLRLLHRLACLALEDAVLGPSPEREAAVGQAVDALPARLRAPAGAFVTLKRYGALRGCVGYIDPIEPLYRAVLDNGDKAARRDPRFQPVQVSELDGLEVEVSVLTPPHPIASWEQFRVGEEGIVLTQGNRRAVYLPEVAAMTGWTREETLSQLALKAGLPEDAWRNGASLAVFNSRKYAAPYAASAAAGGVP